MKNIKLKKISVIQEKQTHLTEQTLEKTEKEILEKAIEFNCLEGIKFQSVGKTPVLAQNRYYIEAKGTKGTYLIFVGADKNIYFIKAGDKENIYKVPPCDKLKEFIESSKVSPVTEPKNVSSVTEPTKPSGVQGDKSQVEKDIEAERANLESQRPKACADSINSLYDFYEKAKKGYTIDKTRIENIKINSKKCLSEPDIKRKLLFGKLPIVGDKFKKRLEILQNINQRDSVLGIFSLMEQVSLSKLIKKTLQETKELKEQKKFNERIVEVRLKNILKDPISFVKFSEQKKIKTGFKFLKESNELRNSGFLNENLSDFFKSIYGKSFESLAGNISEPLLKMIFDKIGLDEITKNNSIENIKNKSSELVANMESCQTLSKFISDVVYEEFIKKLDTEMLAQSELLNSSLMDSIDDEMFRKNLSERLEKIICELYTKFTENAKNLVVRMSAL